MSTTKATIAIATAAGVLAVASAGAVTAAQADPAQPAETATTKAQKQARVVALKRTLKTLPDEHRLPLHRFRLSSGWGHSSGPHAGRNHKGQDFAAPTGAPIYSVSDGKVVMARPYYGYGNLVIIRTPAGKRLLYAHQSKMLVKRGETVTAGEQIGKVGSTGHSTGPHLHFEVRNAKDRPFNPMKYLGVGKAALQKRANKLAKLS